MGDNSESLDGAVIMLIVSDWQINMQKKQTCHGMEIPCHRTECTVPEKTLGAVE